MRSFILLFFLSSIIYCQDMLGFDIVDYYNAFDKIVTGEYDKESIDRNYLFNILLLDSSSVEIFDKIAPYVVEEYRSTEIPIFPNRFSVGIFVVESNVKEMLLNKKNVERILCCLCPNGSTGRIDSKVYMKDNKLVFNVIDNIGSRLFIAELMGGVLQVNMVYSITE